MTVDLVRRLFDYDPITGILRWNVSYGSISVGKVAGTLKPDGYITVCIRKTNFPVHRLAWLFMTGSWPTETIDHIDGDRSNNAFTNLREATYGENTRNRRASKNNTSGFRGVTWSKKSRRWQASVRADGRTIHLGLFETKEEAAEAAQIGRIKYHGEFANLSHPPSGEQR